MMSRLSLKAQLIVALKLIYFLYAVWHKKDLDEHKRVLFW